MMADKDTDKNNKEEEKAQEEKKASTETKKENASDKKKASAKKDKDDKAAKETKSAAKTSKAKKSTKAEQEAAEDVVVEKVKTKTKAAAKKDADDNTSNEKAVKDLKGLGDAVQTKSDTKAPAKAQKEQSEEPKEKVQKIDELGRSYATGRRKDAVARVWLKSGSGKVVVNGKDQSVYFARQTQRLVLNQPFLIVGAVGKYDVMCTVKGGGLSGQAGAVRHGISRALENYDPALRPTLKKAGMLTRDDRIVERKKVGKHKARRSKQWAKR